MQEDSIFQRVTSTEGKRLAWEKSKIKKKKKTTIQLQDVGCLGARVCVCYRGSSTEKKRIGFVLRVRTGS